MKDTGFRLDLGPLRRKLEKLQDQIHVESFRQILRDFLRKSLNTATRTTPVRELSRITEAQRKQYANRINYIPSVHTLEDPSLIVKPNGQWLYSGGKWYNAAWKLSGMAYTALQMLLAERDRRMQTAQGEFIKARAQARFLYAKSWGQVGQSISLDVRQTSQIASSLTRRKPAKEPPRGYAQERGSKTVLSVAIYNPFTQVESMWKDWDGADILASAASQHRSNYYSQLQKQFDRVTFAIFAANA